MKTILRSIVIFLLFFVSGYSGYSQFIRVADRVIVAGYVFDESNSKPLPYVNVYVKRTRVGTITDTSGYFLLNATIKDTLTISSLGYNNKYVVLNDTARDNSEPLIIFLDTRIYELKSVDVIALRRYKQFEYEFTNMKLPEDDYTYAARNFPFKPKDIDYYSRHDLSVAGFVFHPISALYEAFSKEGRERQKLEEIKKQDIREQLLHEKINMNLVMKITNMNHEDANVFLKWCNFSPEFLFNLTEYEFAQILTQKYEEYTLRRK
ncbi:MAG: carboxypeptidase-like regulatory domain-containing protein [Bacteroidales bacterium]|nr:carboxypeptidase-like regulatory domain-containing protein [Bacteroidales bacterium]